MKLSKNVLSKCVPKLIVFNKKNKTPQTSFGYSRAHSDQGKQPEDRPGDESGGSDPIKVVSWNCVMSKTFELPIDVLEIQFCFWNAKTFWSSFRGEMLYLVQSKMFWHSRNEIGFPEH